MARGLLLLELDAPVVRDLKRGLVAEGFRVDTAIGAAHAQDLAAMRRYDGKLLFGTDCLALESSIVRHCRDMAGAEIPLIAITNATEAEEVRLLSAGAACCLSPQTPFPELLSRLRALIDIAEGFPRHYRILDLGIDPVTRRASRAGVPLSIRPREFDLLIYFVERIGKPVSPEELHRVFWPDRSPSRSRIAVQIHNLRRAIGQPENPPLLHTLAGDGYMFSASPPTRFPPARLPHAPCARPGERVG